MQGKCVQFVVRRRARNVVTPATQSVCQYVVRAFNVMYFVIISANIKHPSRQFWRKFLLVGQNLGEGVIVHIKSEFVVTKVIVELCE